MLLLCVAVAMAQIDYSDGGQIELAAPLNNSVRVDYNAAAGIQTEFTVLEGGSISGSLDAYKSARIVLQGGSVGQDIAAYGNSRIVIYGGTIAWYLTASENSRVTIYGSGFKLDGIPVTGDITSIYGDQTWFEIPRQLTGILADGGEFNNEILVHNNAKIVLIPEPAAIVFLTLGAIALRKKRKPALTQ